MSRSGFDPRGGETDRSGSRSRGAEAENSSHPPTDAARGEVDDVASAENGTDAKDETEELQQYRFRQKSRKRGRNAR